MKRILCCLGLFLLAVCLYRDALTIHDLRAELAQHTQRAAR